MRNATRAATSFALDFDILKGRKLAGRELINKVNKRDLLDIFSRKIRRAQYIVEKLIRIKISR